LSFLEVIKAHVCTKHEVVLHGYFSSNFSTWEAFGSSVNTTLEMFAYKFYGKVA